MVRSRSLAALALVLATPASAADKPAFGPPPEWVKPTTAAPAPEPAEALPLQVLLSDQQVWIHGDSTSRYNATTIKVLRPEALTALGTFAVAWKPDSDRLTVHAVRIRRGEQVIDVLGKGDGLTILRREDNLERAMIDGMLTATMQLPGLQVGDAIEFAYTLDRSEPLLRGHHDLVLDAGSGGTIAALNIAARWDGPLPMTVSPVALPAAPVRGRNTLALQANAVTPPVVPQGAPARYLRGRTLQLSDYADWGEVGAVFAPLYDAARKPAADSPLHAEVARIAAASPDPLVRAGLALALVEDKVRYLFVGLADSNLRPAHADETWQRRFGDCKAKSALLLALLDGLGITAEPALASMRFGDGLDRRPPGIVWFDHVIVRASIAGKTFWLDPTRSGDRDLTALKVPDLHWALPLRSGKLEALVIPVPDKPVAVHALHLDARAGVYLPAAAHGESTFTGDAGLAFHRGLAALPPAQREQALIGWWRDRHDFITPTKVAESRDEASGVTRLTMDGTARMDWNLTQRAPYYEIDGGTVGWKPDYHRDPGPDADAPFDITFPDYAEFRETIDLPNQGAGFRLQGANVDTVLAQRAIHRETTLRDGRISMVAWQRPLAGELAFAEAQAAEPKLRELARDSAYVVLDSTHYEPTSAELDDIVAHPDHGSEQGYYRHIFALETRGRYPEALAAARDFATAYPKAPMALAQRAIAQSLTGDRAGAAASADAALALQPDFQPALAIRAYLQWLAQPEVAEQPEAARPNFLASMQWARARDCMNKGDSECALAAGARALAIQPMLSDLYVLRANAFKRQQRPDEAAAEARRMIAVAPKDSEMLAVAGVILSSLGRTPEGMRAFAASLAAKPNVTAYVNRARFLPQGDFAARRRDLDAALALDPQDDSVRLALVALLRDQGDEAGAVQALESFVAGLKGGPFANPAMAMQLGAAYARAGMADKARAQFAMLRGYAAGTRSAEDYNNLCYEQATAGFDLEAALADCRQAIALRNSPHILDSLAFTELRLGRYAEAIADYDKALAITPDLPEARYGRALARLRSGDRAGAEADLATVRTRQPEVVERFARMGLKP